MTESHLELHGIVKHFGSQLVVDDVALTVAPGEFVSLLGPSGCGKTTLLRIVAGFEQPDAGTVLVDGTDITRLAPNRRPVGIVFQRGALFPHRTVAENVGYALRRQRVPKREAAAKVEEMLALVRLEGLGDRRPSQLSGGQAQRVALARALASEPAVLLLDEPLSALDLQLRKEMQLELRHLQRRLGTTFVFVTHDQEEALVLSDRIMVMNQARIVQTGTPREVYDDPASRFVSTFIGESNLLAGRIAARDEAGTRILVGDQELLATGPPPPTDVERVALSIRPERVHMVPRRTSRPGWNEVDATVEEVVFAGNRVRLRLSTRLGTDLWLEQPPSGVDGVDATGLPTIVAWRTDDTRLIPT